jgi:RNA polymerase sigma-70 factor (ECF subfamily)
VENPLAKLYTEHFRALHRFAVGLTGSVDEASDIVQNVFMRLASRQRFESTSITKAYLFSAVRNGAKDVWKRKRPIPFSQRTVANDMGEEVGIDIPDDAPGLLEQAEVSSEFAFVLKAFQFLTEEQREILSLKYFSELSTREIALEIGKNENAVRQMEFRALCLLRRVLQGKKDKNV